MTIRRREFITLAGAAALSPALPRFARAADKASVYDIERFGIINTGNAKHADIFLVTGSVNEQNRSVIKNLYDQMADPKVVVAIGICATSGGIFRTCYNVQGGIDKLIPVDVYVPGCAARPESIIDGVVKALGVLEQKAMALKHEQIVESV